MNSLWVTHRDQGVVVYAMFVLMVVFCIPFYPMPREPNGYISPLLLALAYVGFFLLFARGAAPYPKDRPFKVLVVAFSILIAVEMVGIALFEPPLLQAKYAAARLVQFGFFVALTSFLYSHQRKAVSLIFIVLVASAVVTSILIVLQGFGYMSLGNEASGRSYFGVAMPFRKATGVNISDGKLGTLLVPAFLISIIALFRQRVLPKRLALLGALIIPWGILISQSRSMWLGFVLSLLVLQFYLISDKKLRRLTVGLYLVIVTIAVHYDLPQVVVEGLVSEGVYARNVENRFEGAVVTLGSSSDNLLLGVGKGVFKLTHDNGVSVVVHNMFLDQLSSSGVMGVLPLVFIYLYVFVGVRSRLTSALYRANPLKYIYLVVMLAILVDVLVEVNLYRAYYNEYLSLYLALSVFLISRKTLESSSSLGSRVPSERVPVSRSQSLVSAPGIQGVIVGRR